MINKVLKNQNILSQVQVQTDKVEQKLILVDIKLNNNNNNINVVNIYPVVKRYLNKL